MRRKKSDADPVLSELVSKVVSKPVSKEVAGAPQAVKKPRAAKPATTGAPKSKSVTHRHKKTELTSTAEATVQTSAASKPENVHGEIARIAYSYYEARGHQPGSADEDWIRAEREFWSRFE